MQSLWQERSWHWRLFSHKTIPAGVKQIVCQLTCTIFSVLESDPFAGGTCMTRHTIPSLRGSPHVHSSRQIPQSSSLFSGGTAGLGKATQEARGGFLAPASSLAHSGQEGSNQAFTPPGLCLSSHKTWITITLSSQWGWESLFGNVHKMTWLKGSVEGQCFNYLLLVL